MDAWPTAVHEAGHAMIAQSMGYRVEAVDIVRREHRGHIIEGGCQVRERIDDPTDCAALYLAGSIAERVLCGVHPIPGTDEECVQRIFAEQFPGRPRKQERVRCSLEDAVRRKVQLLGAPIMAIAAELMRYRRLDEAAVLRVLRGWAAAVQAVPVARAPEMAQGGRTALPSVTLERYRRTERDRVAAAVFGRWPG